LARRQRRFEHNPRIRRLALRRPVLEGKLERPWRPTEQVQSEARLLAQMHAVAAPACRIEPGLQQRDVLLESLGAEPLLGQAQTEQQRIDPGLALE
jgi:hypothetical protein